MHKEPDSINPEKSPPSGFDPFNDRFSRDIRNSLSEALVQALMQVDKSYYRQAAERRIAENPDEAHISYIQDRLIRYDRVFDQITTEKIDDPKRQAVILWNNRLFFEVHEHLEQIWHQTAGEEHQALKGLIQAAGVYVHLEFNHQPAAERLAAKSRERLEKYSGYLTFIDNLNLLLDKLRSLDRSPPLLMSTAP
jgi:hypothetical protein